MNSSTHGIFNEDEIQQTIHDIIIELNERIANYQREGSGWVFDKIIDFHVSVHKHAPLHGSSYMDIPRDVGNTKAVINVKNKDDMCFKWSILAALHPVKKKPERVSKYREYERELNFDGISFPVSLKDITKFETKEWSIGQCLWVWSWGVDLSTSNNENEGRQARRSSASH